MPSLPQQIGQVLADRIRKKLDPNIPPPPMGMDNPRLPPPLPAPPPDPFRPQLSGNSVIVPLPANKGANFEGYANFDWNVNHPLDLKMNGAGIRYRYTF